MGLNTNAPAHHIKIKGEKNPKKDKPRVSCFMLNPLCLIPLALELYYHSLQLTATVYYVGREVDVCPLEQI